MKSIRILIKYLVSLTGYTLEKVYPFSPQRMLPITKEHFIELYFSLVVPKELFFVQIGAHDGHSADPIYPSVTKYGLRGVCVEPQPDAFERLKETYRNFPQVKCVNTLIGKEAAPFFVIKKGMRHVNTWEAMTRIASLDKEVVKRSLRKKIPKGANPDDYIEEVNLPTLSFKELITQEGVERIDILQIDAEGYDYEILKMLDFSKFHPHIINFESMHFNACTREACEALLKQKGYNFFRDGSDTCAYRVK